MELDQAREGGSRTGRLDLGTHQLAVELWGSGKPVLVCLHGLGDTRSTWYAIAPQLERRGCAVLVDQRAHGESSAPLGPYTLTHLTSDIGSLLDELEISNAFLIGHGMGGTVAMGAAIAFPERVSGMVLIGAATRCSLQVAAWYEEVAQSAERGGTAGARQALFGSASRREIVADAIGLAHTARALKSLHRSPLSPARVRCPTFVLVGSRDFMGPAASRAIQTDLQTAILEVVRDRGHWLHLEAPDVVVAAVDRLLRLSSRSPISCR